MFGFWYKKCEQPIYSTILIPPHIALLICLLLMTILRMNYFQPNKKISLHYLILFFLSLSHFFNGSFLQEHADDTFSPTVPAEKSLSLNLGLFKMCPCKFGRVGRLFWDYRPQTLRTLLFSVYSPKTVYPHGQICMDASYRHSLGSFNLFFARVRHPH